MPNLVIYLQYAQSKNFNTGFRTLIHSTITRLSSPVAVAVSTSAAAAVSSSSPSVRG